MCTGLLTPSRSRCRYMLPPSLIPSTTLHSIPSPIVRPSSEVYMLSRTQVESPLDNKSTLSHFLQCAPPTTHLSVFKMHRPAIGKKTAAAVPTHPELPSQGASSIQRSSRPVPSTSTASTQSPTPSPVRAEQVFSRDPIAETDKGSRAGARVKRGSDSCTEGNGVGWGSIETLRPRRQSRRVP